MKTYQLKAKEVQRKWHLLDAKDFVLGRLASQAATLLIGKHKADYTPHIESGDWVVVVNAEKINLTGKKAEQKVYRSHSGYPKGLKEISFAKLSREHPERIIEHAVAGMLPDNRLKKDRMARLKIVVGAENPYAEKFNG
jgi:large subunit ribosomal protein L13